MAISTAILARNDEVDALVAYMSTNGKLILYDGTPPATADTALAGGNHVLVTLVVPSWSVTNDTATAAAITPVAATGTGTASFFRAFKTNGTTAVFQGTVGTAGSDLVLNDVGLVTGAAVSVLSATYQLPA